MRLRPDAGAPRRDDWLDGCVGFAVESDAGRVGRVAEVQGDADSGRPIALVVRGGLASVRRVVVPLDDVVGVVPSSQRIILNGFALPSEEASPRSTGRP